MEVTNHKQFMDQEEALKQLKIRLQDIRYSEDNDTVKLSNDFYLYQWLKAGNLNVDKTEIMIRNSFKWRKDNKIFSEVDDFPMDVAKKFPIYTDAMSKSRRPVGTMNGGCWDVKKYLDDGGMDRFVRYCALMTLQTENVWFANNLSLHKKVNDPPNNIIFIINTLHYSFKQIGPSTTACVIQILHNIANYFPPMVERVVFINATSGGAAENIKSATKLKIVISPAGNKILSSNLGQRSISFNAILRNVKENLLTKFELNILFPAGDMTILSLVADLIFSAAPPLVADLTPMCLCVVAKVFSIALKIIRPFISFLKLQVHGCDENKWKGALAEFVTMDQLRPEFGGSFHKNEKLLNTNYFSDREKSIETIPSIFYCDTSRSH